MGSTFVSPRAVGAPGIPYYTPINNPGAAIDPGPHTPTLFQPLKIRNFTLKNRIIVAPMCMASSEADPESDDVGTLTDFHIAHLGHFATKCVGLVMIEATAVQPNGRISSNDSGLWQGTNSSQFRALRRVADIVHSQGAKLGIQLAHAGRKGRVVTPWVGGRGAVKAYKSAWGWPDDVIAPSCGEEFKWSPGETSYWAPRDLSVAEIAEVVAAFARRASTAVDAGVDVIEVHGAHGYLLRQFLSPITNRRDDKYGGSFENRCRIVRGVTTAVRAEIGSEVPLFLRISGTEWLEGNSVAAENGTWDLLLSMKLARLLPEFGVDLVDVSSGGNHHEQSIQPHGNYQVDLAGEIRKAVRAAGQKTFVGAVGLIRDPEAARDIVQGTNDETNSTGEPNGDVVLIAREFLREPNWVFLAAKKLDVKVSLTWQFGRGLL
ncbi:uncharacterized protein N7483_000026 [Penicillium malachiteum]|uniref:uncharacterized protein n=1 Tax=Penicillium malachiteum TaxID=1324776 RepID=UPI002548ECDA|nr:uncharacterized protein N7483_000026 [Penicillium malachiteum]KAJ5734901.1 hypothetical protein N7483_000026 [Penicillium malachiteum]